MSNKASKSRVMKKLAKKLGIPILKVKLVTAEPEDLIGLPTATKK